MKSSRLMLPIPFFLLSIRPGLLAPPLHGALGVWDEIIFGIGFVVSIIIFFALALSDRKRDRHAAADEAHDDND